MGVGFGKENQRMKNHANYFENPGQVNQETIAMEIKFKLKESYYNETKNKEISIKSCMDREEREVGVNSVGDGQDREWVEESQRDWKCSLKHVEAALDQ